MSKKGAIDRFEGDWAVVELETGEFVDIARTNLPLRAKEGSVISIDDKGEVTLLEKETQERKNRAEELMKRLFE